MNTENPIPFTIRMDHPHEDYLWAELQVGGQSFGGEGFCLPACGYARACSTEVFQEAEKRDLPLTGLAAHIVGAGGPAFVDDQTAYDHGIDLIEAALAERADELEDERVFG